MPPGVGLDAQEIKDHARSDLLNLLEGVRGKKNLVLQKSLAGPIGLLVKFSTLQDYGVDKVFFLENANVDASQKNVVFVARGDEMVNVQAIAGDVNISEFPLYFVPLEKDVLSLELENSFEQLYLYKDPTCLFLSARALMTLQQRHGLFPRIIGKGDYARRVADLLLRMRSELAASGDITSSSPSALGSTPSSSMESLIIIDRGVDLVTPLLTQLTYEGLIDEMIGIQHNQAEVESSIVGSAPTPPSSDAASSNAASAGKSSQALSRKIPLDATDKLYDQLRDCNFAIVGSTLNKIARRLESDYESRHGARSTAELREFVNKLPGYQAEQQSLRIHTGLAEEIMKYTRSDFFTAALRIQQHLAAGADPSAQHDAIDELISRAAPLPLVLRLLCLESCIAGGLKARDLEMFKRGILHAYGYQHLVTLDALEKLQLLQPRVGTNSLLLPAAIGGGGGVVGARTDYGSLRHALRLIFDDVNEQDPNDISYVYSGYAPLSVRLVQCVLQKAYVLSITKGSNADGASRALSGPALGWRGFEQALSQARGKTFDETQRGEEKAARARMILNGPGERKTVVVFFLGGITFTEIAALRFIAKQEEARRQILICTTSIISGNRMMEAAIERRSFVAS
ncbi:MAG: hypothetical protein M1826_004394 [Phylliscum demangeonii]|nr:MAG: hypothetical protein M1826_004394 [Phylliscum demangeonii]